MINIKALLGLSYYISELDEFLSEYDKNHPKLSASQRKEMEKYAKVYKLRDLPEPPLSKDSLWDNF